MLKALRKLSLTHWILISMVIGTLIGWAFPVSAQDLKPLSTIFLRMIKSLIAPLIFATLVVGIAGHGDDMKRVGRLALKSLIYFEIVTTLALFIGLAAVNLTRPGDGVDLATTAEKGQELAPEDADARRLPQAHRPGQRVRRGGQERGAADRLLVDPVRRRPDPGPRPAEGGDDRRGWRPWPR